MNGALDAAFVEQWGSGCMSTAGRISKELEHRFKDFMYDFCRYLLGTSDFEGKLGLSVLSLTSQ